MPAIFNLFRPNIKRKILRQAYEGLLFFQETPIRGELIPYIPPKQGGGGVSHFGNNKQQHQHSSGSGGGGPSGPDVGGQWRPVFLCGDRAYVIDGRVARPAPPELLRQELSKTPLGGDVADQLARRAATMVANEQQQIQNGAGKLLRCC